MKDSMLFYLLAVAVMVVGQTVPAAEALKKAVPIHGPLSPEQAQHEFRVDPGLRVELVAAEPDIQSPVAMAFDEDGKLWVVEMRDYPNGPAKGKPPEGRIVILEDDGTGRYRLTRVFAEGLLYANGILPWRGGAIVTCAPHILYLGDCKRQGKADSREVLYEGFAAENPQLRVSHPILGIDNWIYVANGLRGGQIKRAGRANAKPVNISGMDFRFDLIHDREEAVTGMGQYGNTFDDWGNRFVCTNRNHLIPIIMPNHYVKRNPYLAVPEPVRDNQNPGGAARIYPLSANFTTASYHAGTFTASCGVTIYRGGLLPKEYNGSAFTCDPTGNLVHQELLSPDGASFRGRPARDGVEFLASSDDWFRPVSLAHGPDSALYVVDMYRAVIEHPEWMPPEVKNRPDLLLGKDMGRIWRVVPQNYQPRLTKPHLREAATKDLVANLEHAGGWWRMTAQRLLLERQDRAAVKPLQDIVVSSRSPPARAQAAWLLDALGGLNAELVSTVLAGRHPRVCEQGIRLAERWIDWDKAELSLKPLLLESDPRMRFQMGLSLGAWGGDRILPLLAKIGLADDADGWTRMAVASSVPRHAGALIVTICADAGLYAKLSKPNGIALLQELTALVGSRQDPAEVADVLAALAAVPGAAGVRCQLAGLDGLVNGMGRRGTQLAVFLQKLSTARQAVIDQTQALLVQACEVAADNKRDLAERLSAVALLAHAQWATAQPVLDKLIQYETVQEVRLAAVRSLAAYPNPEVAALLLRPWPSLTPAARREVIEAMLRRPERIMALLDEIQAGRMKPGDLDAQRIRQLINHSRPEIRTRAVKLLKDNLPADRKLVLKRYQAALSIKGDTARGKAVFQKNCATCHRVAGMGFPVGPEISDTLGKTPAAILNDILDPNSAIDSNYINYTVTTKNGRLLTGIMVAESSSSVTLKRAENQTDVVLRQDIEEIQSSGVSLMPEGMEKQISIAEMADLLTFLKHWRYEEKGIPTQPAGR